MSIHSFSQGRAAAPNLKAALLKSVEQARADAAHDLSATVHYAGQALADVAIRIQEAWARDEQPAPRHIAALRRYLTDAQSALAVFDRMPAAPVFDHDDAE